MTQEKPGKRERIRNLQQLTEEELKILRWIYKNDLGQDVIAARLGVSKPTVKARMQDIYIKLGLEGLADDRSGKKKRAILLKDYCPLLEAAWPKPEKVKSDKRREPVAKQLDRKVEKEQPPPPAEEVQAELVPQPAVVGEEVGETQKPAPPRLPAASIWKWLVGGAVGAVILSAIALGAIVVLGIIFLTNGPFQFSPPANTPVSPTPQATRTAIPSPLPTVSPSPVPDETAVLLSPPITGTVLSGENSLRVAYIYNTDTAERDSFASLLTARGYWVDLVSLNEAATFDFSADQLIIIGDDTGNYHGEWLGDLTTLDRIMLTRKAILGIGEGGSVFFGGFNMFIKWENTGYDEGTTMYAVNPNSLIWNSPNPISVPADRVVILYTAPVRYLGVWNAAPEFKVTRLGRQSGNQGHYPLIAQSAGPQCFLLWGFENSPTTMTSVGQDLFINVVVNTASGYTCGLTS